MHFFHDIAPSYELTFDIDLGNSWPIWKYLNLLPQYFTLKTVNVLIFSYPIEFEQLHTIIRKSASGRLLGTFHEKTDIIFGDPLLNLIVHSLLWITADLWLWFRCKVGMTIEIAFIILRGERGTWYCKLIRVAYICIDWNRCIQSFTD